VRSTGREPSIVAGAPEHDFVAHEARLVHLRDTGQDDLLEDEHRRVLGLCESALGASPEDPARRRDLGAAYESYARDLARLGRLDDAECVWAEAIKHFDDVAAGPEAGPYDHLRAAEARNDLAWALANSPGSCDESMHRALRWVQSVTALVGDQPTFWNTLASVHYRLGNRTTTIDVLERTARFGLSCPGHDDFLLAMAYHQAGDHRKAREWLDRGSARLSAMVTAPPDLLALRDEAQYLIGSGAPTSGPSRVLASRRRP